MKRFAFAASALCLATPAFAADLPSRYAPAPYYDPMPVFAWSGLYAGVNGAFAFGRFPGGPNSGNPLGGFGGATIGYNYQSGKLLVGAEADIAYGSFSSHGGGGVVSGSSSVNTLGTARVRVGYVWDRALIYATGGYAATSQTSRVGDFSAAPNLIISESHFMNGFAIGAGAEYAITTKISVKGEYLYTGFGSTGYFAGTRDATSISAHINLIRLGLNYHF